MEGKKNEGKITIPCGQLCGGNCSYNGGCIYWEPRNTDFNDRQYCSYYSNYYWPSERNGCLSYEPRYR